MKKIWNTWYLYYNGDADSLLKEIVHPSLQNIEEKLKKEVKFFFIRYFENGYHIRLRLLLSDEESSVFISVLKDQISVYEKHHGVNLTLKEALYIPETKRYGNADTILFAESQFDASSRLVLHNLVQNSSLTASERYLLALKTHFTFFKGMGLSRIYSQQLCDQFIQSWLPLPYSKDAGEEEENRNGVLSAFQQQFEAYQTLLYERVSEFWTALDTTTDPFILQFLKVNHEVWKEYTQSQLPENILNEALLSFIHMTNNRLGIINSEESYVLFLIKQTIPLIHNYDNQPGT